MAQDQTSADGFGETLRGELFSLFATHLPDGVLVIRAEDERIAYANEALERMSGYRKGELAGRSLRDLTDDPQDVPVVLERARTFFENNPNVPWVNHFRLLRKDGSTYWAELRTRALTHPVYGEFWISIAIERQRPEPTERAPTDDVQIAQELLDALPQGLVVLGQDGHVVRTNPVTHGFWPGGREVAPDQLEGLDVWDEHGERLPLGSTPLFLGLREGITTRRKLLHYRAPDGSMISTRLSVVPLSSTRGPGFGVVMLLDDVSQAERVAARRTRALGVTREAVLVVSRTGVIRYANQTARALLGGDGLPEDVSIDVFFEPDSREVLHAALRGIPDGPDTLTGPLRLVARETGGRTFDAEVHLAPNRGVVGQMKEVTVLLTNVSVTEAPLRRQTLLAEAGALLLGSLDPNRTIEHVAELLSRANCDYFAIDLFDDGGRLHRHHVGATRPENDALAQVLRSPPDPELPEAIQVLKEGRTCVSTGADDETPWILMGSGDPQRLAHMLGVRSWMITPLAPRGHVMGALSMLSRRPGTFEGEGGEVFLSLARIAAIAIDNARRFADARAAIDAREQLLRIVAHDLRSPLQSVRLAAELTVRKLDAGVTPDAAQVQAIGRAARRMDRLIADLLDWARIGAGNLVVELNPVEVVPMVQEVMESIRPSAGAHRVSQRVTPDLPRILGDRGRLIQVLVNLASNALKFTPAGGRVTLSAVGREGIVRFTVDDDGPGLEPELRKRVFEPFFQREQGDHRGLGLGLTIASGLIRAHGSRLCLASEQGRGSRFYFDLPAVKDA